MISDTEPQDSKPQDTEMQDSKPQDSENILRCDSCNINFKYLYELIVHKSRSHRNCLSTENKHSSSIFCPECNEELIYGTKFHRHFTHEGKRYTCSEYHEYDGGFCEGPNCGGVNCDG
jgi:uncharacterized C2H2 Zn-finger protein